MPKLPGPAVNHAVASLIAQWNNCTEPQLLREQVNNYAEQGRNQSAQFHFFAGNRFFFNVTRHPLTQKKNGY